MPELQAAALPQTVGSPPIQVPVQEGVAVVLNSTQESNVPVLLV